MSNINDIIAFEQGELEEDEIIELFQSLVDSGMAWQLQGSYGRTACDLIAAGLVKITTKTARLPAMAMQSLHFLGALPLTVEE